MKAFVTGGTGFIGANLVRQLLGQGHEVVCLTRRTSPGLCLEGLDVTLIQADLSDPQAMRRALDGCQQVYHLAGIFDPSPGGRESMFEVHVNATRSLLQAGKAVGIDRLLLCSSSVTVGFGPKSDPGDEDTLIDPGAIYGEDGPLRWYYESKLAAEALVRDFEGVDTVTVNPDFILGAWDIKPTSGQLVLSMMKGWVPVYPKGGKCFMDADDCALGHIGAMERGRSGERYLLGNENHSYHVFMAMISQSLGAADRSSPCRAGAPISWAQWGPSAAALTRTASLDWTEMSCVAWARSATEALPRATLPSACHAPLWK